MHNLAELAHARDDSNISIRRDFDAWLCKVRLDPSITDMRVRATMLASEFLSAPHAAAMLERAFTECWLVKDLMKMSTQPSQTTTVLNVCIRMLLLKDFAAAAWFDDDGQYADVPVSHNHLVLRALCQMFAPVSSKTEHALVKELAPMFHPLFNAEMRVRQLLPGAVFTHLTEDVVYLYVMEVLKRITSKSSHKLLFTSFESYEETGDAASCIGVCAALCKDSCPELAAIAPQILDIHAKVLIKMD